jgi:hypothetical protein
MTKFVVVSFGSKSTRPTTRNASWALAVSAAEVNSNWTSISAVGNCPALAFFPISGTASSSFGAGGAMPRVRGPGLMIPLPGAVDRRTPRVGAGVSHA